jgi:hypothetical protein
LLVPVLGDNDGTYACFVRADEKSHETEVTDIAI